MTLCPRARLNRYSSPSSAPETNTNLLKVFVINLTQPTIRYNTNQNMSFTLCSLISELTQNHEEANTKKSTTVGFHLMWSHTSDCSDRNCIFVGAAAPKSSSSWTDLSPCNSVSIECIARHLSLSPLASFIFLHSTANRVRYYVHKEV